MPQLTDKKNRFFLYVLALIFLSTINNIDIFKKQNSTLQIKNIKVSGLSNENNLKVTNDLNSLLFQNILFINKDKVKKILLENNLIELFEVKKNYPNSVQIDLQKTKFIAITINNNHNFFIGSNGKLISYKDTANNLPFVFGKVNYQELIKFKKIIDDSDFNFENIESIFFFPSNRWDIKTSDGVLIKLPEKNLFEALSIASKIKSNDLLKNNKIIDLRISNNIITSK